MISEFPLLVFTVLTGIAAGLYIAAAVFPRNDEAKPWVLPLVALVLVIVGGLSSMGHLARPELVLGVLNRPMSPLTMEGISAGLLALVAIIDLVVARRDGEAKRGIRIAGAAAGVFAMCVVTSVYVSSYGCPTWTTAPTWPLFFAGDLAAGFACWMALGSSSEKNLGLATCALAVLFTVVLVWQTAVFSGLGEGGTLLIGVGAAFAAVAAALAWLTTSGKFATGHAAIIIAAIALCALVVSRYGFYMASVI